MEERSFTDARKHGFQKKDCYQTAHLGSWLMKKKNWQSSRQVLDSVLSYYMWGF